MNMEIARLERKLKRLRAREGMLPAEQWLTEYLRGKSAHKVQGYNVPAGAEHVERALEDARAAGYTRREIKKARVKASIAVDHVPGSKLWMWSIWRTRVVRVKFPANPALEWVRKQMALGDCMSRRALGKERGFDDAMINAALKACGVVEKNGVWQIKSIAKR